MDADVIVVGGGPAGLAAASVIAEDSTARVLLIDESDRIGGRLPGQLYQHGGRWVVGADVATRLAAEADRAGVEILSGRQVWKCEPGWTVRLTGGQALRSRFVVLATGAAERPLPMPGWDLPGTIAIGAVQQLVQVQRILPGRRVAVIGTDPLAFTAAEEIALAGGEVVGIFLPSGCAGQNAASAPRDVLPALASTASAAPAAWQRWGGRLLRSRAISSIVAKILPRSGVSVGRAKLMLHHRAEAVLGDGRVDAISIRRVNAHGEPRGDAKTIAVDAVCLSGGLYPLQELTAGTCDLVSVEELGGVVPLHSPELSTTASGLYVAGNITGIEGAGVAEQQGRLVGTALAARLGAYTDAPVRIDQAERTVERQRAAAPLAFLPTIVEGRRRMTTLWAQHQLMKVGGTDAEQ